MDELYANDYARWRDFYYSIEDDGSISIVEYCGSEKVLVVPERINGVAVKEFQLCFWRMILLLLFDI